MDPTEPGTDPGTDPDTDLDALVRRTDRLLAASDWDGLAALAARCRRAHERGHQLWPVASRCEYLLALAAPAETAAAVLQPEAGYLALGPLTEVIASTHTAAELEPHLTPGPLRDAVLQERVMRGEHLPEGLRGSPDAPPLTLAPWEPDYPIATYRPDELVVDNPEPLPGDRFQDLPSAPAGGGTAVGARPAPEEGPRSSGVVVEALHATVSHWADASSGQVRVIEVDGDGPDAVRQLAGRGARLAALPARSALARWAWASASGGAHGRRRGLAAARFDLWWALSAVADELENWPPDPRTLGAVVDELAWWWWQPPRAAETGWQLRLAVADPETGLAWAIDAVDGVSDS